MSLSKTADTQLIWRSGLRTSSARPKIGLPELEAEVEAHRRNEPERAEQWLHKVYTEIEDRFLRRGGMACHNDQWEHIGANDFSAVPS